MTYGEFAKIYDELICEDIDYTKIEERILEIISKHNIKFDDYLDLACGTGNVAIRMAKHFKNTYLVDLSEEMLQEAYVKLKKERIKGKVICQDMCELSLNHSFDLITCVLDSTNYIVDIEDLKDYFQGVYKHLKDDGIFIFDINSFYKLSTILGNNIFSYNTDEVFYNWENTMEDDIVNMYLTFFVKNGDLYERFEEEHFERAYKEDEIEEIIKNCGFNIINKFDGYDNKEVHHESERILYILKKGKGK
jgi:ubiquinone/menaquinone biosynthesis C-methylase UbiE